MSSFLSTFCPVVITTFFFFDLPSFVVHNAPALPPGHRLHHHLLDPGLGRRPRETGLRPWNRRPRLCRLPLLQAPRPCGLAACGLGSGPPVCLWVPQPPVERRQGRLQVPRTQGLHLSGLHRPRLLLCLWLPGEQGGLQPKCAGQLFTGSPGGVGHERQQGDELCLHVPSAERHLLLQLLRFHAVLPRGNAMVGHQTGMALAGEICSTVGWHLSHGRGDK